jgi:hypothetical protein
MPRHWDWLAEGTVSSEPVSGRRTSLPQKIFPQLLVLLAGGKKGKNEKTRNPSRATEPASHKKISVSPQLLALLAGGKKGKKEKPRKLENNPMR